MLHRGYVLTSSLYFVTVTHLSASQIIVMAAVMSATLLLSDIPVGVLADTVSRKWVLVAGHAFLAAGMVMTGLVTAFPLLLVTQILWALGWSFSGGADVAWLNDELNQPQQVDRVLMARARSDLTGLSIGVIAFGLLAAVIGLGSLSSLREAGSHSSGSSWRDLFRTLARVSCS